MEKDVINRFTGLIKDKILRKQKARELLDISAPTLDKRLSEGGWRPGEVALMTVFLNTL